MLRKCSKCDGNKERTVDTITHKYVYDGSKYYHYECYVEVLIKRLKTSREEAIIEANRVINLRIEEEKEKQLIDDFYQMIMKLYGQPLPNVFFLKINAVVNGTYKKGMPQKITYKELFEMYSNEKMIAKLDKIAYSSNVKEDNRLLWDLAVMFNEYPNYVKAKKRAIKDSEETKQAIENINKYKIEPSQRYKDVRDKTADANKLSVNIDDIVNDILG